MRAWGCETPPHKVVHQASRHKNAWRGSPRYACVNTQEPQALNPASAVRRRSNTGKSEEEAARTRQRRKSAGDVGAFPIHEDAPVMAVQRRVVFNRAFVTHVAALGHCATEPNSLSVNDASERACQGRLQKIQQEVLSAEQARQELMIEIEQLREQRALEQRNLQKCRKKMASAKLTQGQMEEKLKRCRDVVAFTVDSMDKYYVQKEAVAEGETMDLTCLQAAQARVVQAGVAATELLTNFSDGDNYKGTDEEQDSSFEAAHTRREYANRSCQGPMTTDNTKENLARPMDNPMGQATSIHWDFKKIFNGKQERSPYRAPLCELNTIS